MKLVARLKKSAEGNSYAAWCVANAYEDGYTNFGKRRIVVRKNKRLAFRWMLHAAQLSEVAPMIALGHYLSIGYGCTKNVSEGLKWEKKAFALGETECAAHNIACSYRMLHKYRLAYQWFKKAYASDKGDAFDIGKCYLFGQGVKKNTTTALRYFHETTRVAAYPMDKIHAMYLIADIKSKLPLTTNPWHFPNMPLPVIEKRANCYKDELRRDPENTAANYCLAQLYYGHKRFKDALPYLRKCNQLSFCPEDTIRWLAATYYRLGMIRDEIKLYESCLKSTPKDKWAKRRLKFAQADIAKEADK